MSDSRKHAYNEQVCDMFHAYTAEGIGRKGIHSSMQEKRAALRDRLRELDFILSPPGTMIYIGTPHTMDTIYRTCDDD